MKQSSNVEHDGRSLACVKHSFDERTSGSLKDRVHIALRTAIQAGDLRARTRLRETDLAAVLSVSRTPIREAIQRLETEGLVERTPNGGPIVRGVPKQELKENYEILRVLEAYAAKLAVAHGTDEDFQELQQILDLMTFFREQERWDDSTKQGVLFHNRLYDMSGNTQLATLIKSIRAATHVARRTSLRANPASERQGLQAHYAILDAIRDRDASRAAELMARHIQNAIRRLDEGKLSIDNDTSFRD